MRQPRGWIHSGIWKVGLSGEGTVVIEILPRQKRNEREKNTASSNCPPISLWSLPFIEPSQKPADLEPRKHCLHGVRFPVIQVQSRRKAKNRFKDKQNRDWHTPEKSRATVSIHLYITMTLQIFNKYKNAAVIMTFSFVY